LGTLEAKEHLGTQGVRNNRDGDGMVTVTTQYRYLHCILKLKLNLNRLELAKRIKILLVLALGPSHRVLARAFNSRPETSPTRAIPEPDPGPERPGRPAGFLDFSLFCKRISNETDLNDDLHIFLSCGLTVL